MHKEYNFMTLTMDEFTSTHFQKARTVIHSCKHYAWSDVFAVDQKKKTKTKQYSDAVRLNHEWHFTQVRHAMLYRTSQASSNMHFMHITLDT